MAVSHSDSGVPAASASVRRGSPEASTKAWAYSSRINGSVRVVSSARNEDTIRAVKPTLLTMSH
ncbi:Uncharacterised protein [Mycobacteroides abscessus subsp. abscessus]|nr:Uncharacterised protein [Mycobacteroides abscessus subsp. abscessus]